MIRRNARLRREYLYRKSLEGKERDEYERKRKIKQALEGEIYQQPLLRKLALTRRLYTYGGSCFPLTAAILFLCFVLLDKFSSDAQRGSPYQMS